MISPLASKRSQLAWPAVLGRKLACKVINRGVGGSCNKQITYSIMKVNFRPDDVVMILWTYPLRHSLLVSPRPSGWDGMMHGATWEEHRPYQEPIDEYYKRIVNNPCDSHFLTGIYINQAHLYLNSLGIENYHYQAKNDQREFFPWVVPEVNQGLLGPDYAKQQGVPDNEIYALDGKHMGTWAHEELAQRMFDKHFSDAII